LHDVKVVIYEKDLRRTASVLFVNFDEGVDAARVVWLSEVPVEVILPEETRITFVRQNESVRQQLVVDDGTITYHIVVLDEADSLLRTVPHQDSVVCDASEAESITIAKVAETPP
jgi:hypothetical protein